MSHVHALPTPWPLVESDTVDIWLNPHITLHQDAFMLACYLVWILVGLAIYLFGHGLAERPRPFFALICGPGAWIAGIYKCVRIAYIRRPYPPVVTKPPPLKHWEFPKQRGGF